MAPGPLDTPGSRRLAGVAAIFGWFSAAVWTLGLLEALRMVAVGASPQGAGVLLLLALVNTAGGALLAWGTTEARRCEREHPERARRALRLAAAGGVAGGAYGVFLIVPALTLGTRLGTGPAVSVFAIGLLAAAPAVCGLALWPRSSGRPVDAALAAPDPADRPESEAGPAAPIAIFATGAFAVVAAALIVLADARAPRRATWQHVATAVQVLCLAGGGALLALASRRLRRSPPRRFVSLLTAGGSGLAALPGMVALFAGTGLLPFGSYAHAFYENGGRALAGVVWLGVPSRLDATWDAYAGAGLLLMLTPLMLLGWAAPRLTANYLRAAPGPER